MTSTIKIRQTTLNYELEGKLGQCPITEFFIDGEPLSALLGIERDMGSSECDLDRVTKSINPELTKRMIDELTAMVEPFNQFASNRAVLYRCHCGSDYCGVISCRIVEAGDQIEWHDVTYEDSNGPAPNGDCCDIPGLKAIKLFSFNKNEYISEVLRFDHECA